MNKIKKEIREYIDAEISKMKRQFEDPEGEKVKRQMLSVVGCNPHDEDNLKESVVSVYDHCMKATGGLECSSRLMWEMLNSYAAPYFAKILRGKS